MGASRILFEDQAANEWKLSSEKEISVDKKNGKPVELMSKEERSRFFTGLLRPALKGKIVYWVSQTLGHLVVVGFTDGEESRIYVFERYSRFMFSSTKPVSTADDVLNELYRALLESGTQGSQSLYNRIAPHFIDFFMETKAPRKFQVEGKYKGIPFKGELGWTSTGNVLEGMVCSTLVDKDDNDRVVNLLSYPFTKYHLENLRK